VRPKESEKHETGGHDAGGTGRGREGGRGGLDVDRKSRDRCRNYVPDPFARQALVPTQLKHGCSCLSWDNADTFLLQLLTGIAVGSAMRNILTRRVAPDRRQCDGWKLPRALFAARLGVWVKRKAVKRKGSVMIT
jgi:hypothetical protein